ncbi:MAG: GntR family transcriptional regulator [Myxococcaceae bacterium]
MSATSEADVAYDLIKQGILSCAIRPQERLTEAGLEKRVKLGRAAVRSALKRLYQEALVDVLPRYGYVVAGMDELHVDDLYELQLVLEPTAARLAAGRVDPGDLRALDLACRDATDLRTEDDATRFLEANTRFHVAIAAASGNALLARFVRILYERQERQMYASGRAAEILRRSAHHHGPLVELLIAGQAEEAESVARSQILHNHKIILAALAERAGPRRGPRPGTA